MNTGLIVASAAVSVALLVSRVALAREQPDRIELIVDRGTSLRVALEERVSVKRAGQPIAATVIEPVYAYDRIVIEAGAKVRGQVAAFDPVSKSSRLRAMLGGDLTPPHRLALAFDTLLLPDGREMPIVTIVSPGTPDMTRQSAGASHHVPVVEGPSKKERLKDALISRLPYHPQILRKGTVYSATLTESLEFGSVVPTPRAPAGTAPPPDSILHARLVGPLDSKATPRGSPVAAVLTRPVISSDQELILPAGTALTGEVTFAKPARHFRRNGQLRLLFESIHAPEQNPDKLLASVHSVEASRNDRLVIDGEGGAKVSNSKTRFIAPALAAVALGGVLHGKMDYDTDGGPPAVEYGNETTRGIGGFLGLGVIGAALSQTSRAVGTTLGVVGVVTTVYSSVFAKGHEVSFPADTRFQLQLAPRPVK